MYKETINAFKCNKVQNSTINMRLTSRAREHKELHYGEHECNHAKLHN